jgi:hypothetical protein
MSSSLDGVLEQVEASQRVSLLFTVNINTQLVPRAN